MEQTCSVCGETSPAGFRFCGNCGAPLGGGTAVVAPEELEERKVVTVLFADLTASTELAARLDPEDLRGVLTPYFEAMVDEVSRFGGTVEKFAGDAVVVIFGVPASHEDDPERAVRASLAMHRRLGELNEQLAASGGERLQMRIGVNTGEVVTATGVDRDNLVTGQPVNVAARFEALAEPGAVVVGERTYRDTRHAMEYRSLGQVSVKGIDRPLPAWEVVGERPQATGPGALSAPLVGREEELELLRLLFGRSVREGRPSLATVLGPPGIGKSRLSHEFATLVGMEEPEPRVVRGRCLPYGDGLTYWPLAEVLKDDAGILDSDPPEAIREKARARLEERFSEEERSARTVDVLLSSIGVPVDANPLEGAEPGAAKELIARAWRSYFESMAARSPLVVLFEDLHWADLSLLDVVEGLAARGTGAMLLLCMARPELSERRPTWGSGARSATTIELSPLSAEEGRALASHLLGHGEAPAEAVDMVLARAEGNPFYAGELLRMLIDEGILALEGGRWRLERALPASLPDNVQGVIASRIDLLPPSERRACQDAAVVGRIFWQGAVGHLGTADPMGPLDAMARRGLAWERDRSVIEGDREMIFNHILTRDVAYQSIPRARRGEAHAAAGSWIEEKTAGRAEEFAEVLAYHFELAGDAERTVRYAMLAGHRSRRVFAAEEAIRWYDRALETGAGMPEPGPFVAETALARGEAKEQLGRFAEAEQDYDRAVGAAREANEAALEARALAALAHIMWLEDRFQDGRRALGEALAKARAVEVPGLLAPLLYTAGTLSFGLGDYAEALRFHEEAVAVAQAEGDLRGESLARHGLCETRFFLGPFDEALAQGLKADELFRSLGQRPMVFHNEYMVAWGYWLHGRLDESEQAFTSALEGCREVGNRRDEGFSRSRGYLYLQKGEVGLAQHDFSEGVRIAQEINTPRLEMVHRAGNVELYADLFASDLAREEIGRFRELSDSIGGRFFRPRAVALEGWLALREGRATEAESSFREAQEVASESLQDRLWASTIELKAREETRDAAAIAVLLPQFAEARASHAAMFAWWERYGRALFAHLSGDQAAAIEHAERVLAAAEAVRARPLLWRALALLAEAHQDDDPAGAEDLRRRGASVVEQISESIPDEHLRASFLSRPDVASLLAGRPAVR